ncbi:hypothetical protein, partial [Nocardia wallacei]|uniref:hypothetical protein n=1 Tax=Nocardia wallacei TaxID=480035 RepID=UPI002458B9B1
MFDKVRYVVAHRTKIERVLGPDKTQFTPFTNSPETIARGRRRVCGTAKQVMVLVLAMLGVIFSQMRFSRETGYH